MKQTLRNFLVCTALLCAAQSFSFIYPDVVPGDFIEIILIKKIPDSISENNGPSKKPALQTCPVHVYYDEACGSLYFVGNDGTIVSYAIYDEDDSLLQSDSVALSNGANAGLHCSYADMYTIEITVNGITYSGVL